MTTATHKLGKDFRINVCATSTGTFVPVAGEMTLSVKASSDKIDTSSKDDGVYKTQTYGQKDITIAVSGNLKLPDPGFALCFTTQKASPPEFYVQIVNTVTTPVIVFQSAVGIGNFATNFADKGAATYSFDLSLAGVPTIDDMTLITS
jgi:predicted secreted protein